MSARNVLRPAAGALLLLLVPVVAMLVTDEVRWGLFDVAAMGVLLAAGGGMFGLLSSRAAARPRAVVLLALLAAITLVWAELAVGVVGSPVAGD